MRGITLANCEESMSPQLRANIFASSVKTFRSNHHAYDGHLLGLLRHLQAS